jgi:hypothetical protein
VVELEDRRIREAAIRAGAVAEDVGDVSPGDGSTLVSGVSALTAVEISALPHVLPAAVFARALPAMEMSDRQSAVASIAMSSSRPCDLADWRRSRRGRHDDV